MTVVVMMMSAALTTVTETEQPRKVPAFAKPIFFLNLFKKCNFKRVEQTMYSIQSGQTANYSSF